MRIDWLSRSRIHQNAVCHPEIGVIGQCRAATRKSGRSAGATPRLTGDTPRGGLVLQQNESEQLVTLAGTRLSSEVNSAWPDHFWSGAAGIGGLKISSQSLEAAFNSVLYANGEASCRSATQRFRPGHPANWADCDCNLCSQV